MGTCSDMQQGIYGQVLPSGGANTMKEICTEAPNYQHFGPKSSEAVNTRDGTLL